MYLGFFTEEAYEKLLGDVSVNISKYQGNEQWLDDYFGRGVVYHGVSSQPVNKFTPYFSCNETKSDDDITNAINIYEQFKLTPLQATNKYMWSYMCHADPDCRKYIQRRWADGKIEQRYFVPGGGEGLYYFNALSRLWWCAHLTYDKDSKEHYKLTKILLSNQMIAKDFLGTLHKNNFTRTKGVLLALQEFKEEIGAKEGLDRYFRACNRILNHNAAFNMFDYLGYEEIQKMTFDTLVEVRRTMKGEK